MGIENVRSIKLQYDILIKHLYRELGGVYRKIFTLFADNKPWPWPHKLYIMEN